MDAPVVEGPVVSDKVKSPQVVGLSGDVSQVSQDADAVSYTSPFNFTLFAKTKLLTCSHFPCRRLMSFYAPSKTCLPIGNKRRQALLLTLLQLVILLLHLPQKRLRMSSSNHCLNMLLSWTWMSTEPAFLARRRNLSS